MSNKYRLDKELLRRGLVVSRSQAEDIIRRGFVSVAGISVTKPGLLVSENVQIVIKSRVSFVSRAGEKLHSVLDILQLDLSDKVVLDVGSSTGGFTELALRMGAKKVIAVDVGTNQMHPSLRNDPRIELHEKTDIRNYVKGSTTHIDVVLIDVSFISLRQILPYCATLIDRNSVIVAMAKPQFEARLDLPKAPPSPDQLISSGSGLPSINVAKATSPSVKPLSTRADLPWERAILRKSSRDIVKHKGVIKNDKMRREILKHLEDSIQNLFIIIDKADSGVAGARGNRERFYLLRKAG
ncbi:TlyA family RNA methyltransferase [Candidatus Saccharibacteria bacterium]|nr:TlyA family RNA methyltransferase [Candidatus Saccharibacteria bacterium]MBI3337820.1 TlyA family RNA methyltransferase [Candidatus Saccharibacteria bacterium]